ncbi:MAG: hypothetical protein LBN38_06090, partial [Verrucomicrobiota bacterium]|nr:hypothetical protein [Verrucomicrobiota bacterium]
AFEQAVSKTRAQDDKAVLSASGAANQTAAILVNDKAIPYRAETYERTLVHHYQAMNYLAANDLSGAGVEVRRANQVQEDARRRFEREAAKAGRKAEAAQGGEEDPGLSKVYAGLNELAGSVKASYQNAATFYLSAVIWEMLGLPNDAYIDYKKALEIVPGNGYLQQDVIRLGKRLGMREDVADFSRRFPAMAGTPADGAGPFQGKGRLVVVYEEGLVPSKTSFSLPYPLFSDGAIGMLAIPMYSATPPPALPLTVSMEGKGVGQSVPICNISALAGRALAEKMPGIVTRQIARSISKGVATSQAEGWGALALSLYSLLSEQADLRSWLTLPAHIQIFSTWAAPGQPTVSLSSPSGGVFFSEPVSLYADKTTLMYISRIDLASYCKIFIQP